MVDVAIVTSHPEAYESALAGLVADHFATRLAAKDTTLWEVEARSEAAKRLDWVNLPTASRPLIAVIEDLRATTTGLDHVVLCGMGGSSLAPEVICAAAGVELTVLDTSQPDMVRSVLGDRLERTVVVVSSKSGSTVETDSHRRVYEDAFTSIGRDPRDHIVVVTDPGSPLDQQAREAGYRVVNADPEVGGRYSALTAFGLVPSGLAGVDVDALLSDAAASVDQQFADTASNPGLQLGALMATAQAQGVDKLVLADHTGNGLGDWIEQLVAESTGKEETGILPVVVPGPDAPNFDPSTSDGLIVAIGTDQVPAAKSGFAAAIDGPLAAQMLMWEIATVVAGRLLDINPFDQPDVESAKAAARELLGGSASHPEPDSVDGHIELFGSTTGSIKTAIDDLMAQLDPDHGYLAIQAYLDRLDYSGFALVRETAARRTQRPVTFGWGPRFLHSTGQFHKGGTPSGVFLQITCEPEADVAIPGREFTFGQFCDSQAAGDARVLLDKGRPVLRLHLSSTADLRRVAEALA